MTTKILICSDSKVDGKALLDLCAPDLEIELFSQASESQAAGRMVGELQPDIVIVDTTLPDFDIQKTFRQILGARPDTQIVALSRASSYGDITKLIVAGAQAYLPPHPEIGELRDAVEALINNRIYISHRLADNASPAHVSSNSSLLKDRNTTSNS